MFSFDFCYVEKLKCVIMLFILFYVLKIIKISCCSQNGMTCLSISTQVTITVRDHRFSGLYTFIFMEFVRNIHCYKPEGLWICAVWKTEFYSFHFSSVFGLVFHSITNSTIAFYLLIFLPEIHFVPVTDSVWWSFTERFQGIPKMFLLA